MQSIAYPSTTNCEISAQYFNTSKLINEMINCHIEISNSEEDSLINEIEVEHKKLITCQLWNDANVHFSSPVNAFDKNIMDAIYTLYLHGVTVFTDAQIEKVLSGNMTKRSTENNIVQIRDSIYKLSSIHIAVDYSEQMFSRKACNNGKQYSYTSYVLPVDICKVVHSENGLVTEGYKLLRKPLIYQYGEDIKQIIRVDSRLLDTQHLFSDTKESILIKRYVVQRVMQMKNPKNKMISKRIALVWSDNSPGKGLINALGFSEDIIRDRKKMSRIRNHIINCLNHLVTSNEIQSFTVVKRGNSIIGYDITL